MRKYRTCASHLLVAVGADAGQAQLQLLLAELKRIEGQQQQLKSAAAHNEVLIVHPVKGFNLDAEDEYAEEFEVKPDPDKFIPSGQPPQTVNPAVEQPRMKNYAQVMQHCCCHLCSPLHRVSVCLHM